MLKTITMLLICIWKVWNRFIVNLTRSFLFDSNLRIWSPLSTLLLVIKRLAILNFLRYIRILSFLGLFGYIFFVNRWINLFSRSLSFIFYMFSLATPLRRRGWRSRWTVFWRRLETLTLMMSFGANFKNNTLCLLRMRTHITIRALGLLLVLIYVKVWNNQILV